MLGAQGSNKKPQGSNLKSDHSLEYENEHEGGDMLTDNRNALDTEQQMNNDLLTNV
jgi:hypothetical protein